jgi:hypothetical protein
MPEFDFFCGFICLEKTIQAVLKSQTWGSRSRTRFLY